VKQRLSIKKETWRFAIILVTLRSDAGIFTTSECSRAVWNKISAGSETAETCAMLCFCRIGFAGAEDEREAL